LLPLLAVLFSANVVPTRRISRSRISAARRISPAAIVFVRAPPNVEREEVCIVQKGDAGKKKKRTRSGKVSPRVES
jgi:hypothetical protein